MIAPTLYNGIVNIGQEGVGRLPVGGDTLLDPSADLYSFIQPTNFFADLFTTSTLDNLFPNLPDMSATLPDKVPLIQEAVDTQVVAIMDWVTTILGPNHPLRSPTYVAVDIEEALYGGSQPTPWHDATYGVARQRIARMLLNRLDYIGRKDYGVNVRAFTYKPLRPTGVIPARRLSDGTFTPISAAFIAQWGIGTIKDHLLTRDFWVHLYHAQSQAELDPGSPDTTFRDHAYRNVQYAIQSATWVGYEPETMWFAIWLGSGITNGYVLEDFLGIRDALADFGHLLPRTRFKIAMNGDWQILQAVDPTFVKTNPGTGQVPGTFSQPPNWVAANMADLWNTWVAPAYREVFLEPVGGTTIPSQGVS